MRNYAEWVKTLNTRQVLYALLILSKDVNGIVIQNNPDYLTSVIKELDDAFEQDILKNLEDKIKIGMLDDKELSWIKDDLRAAIWFGIYYSKNFFINIPTIAPIKVISKYYPSYIDNLILNLDVITINVDNALKLNDRRLYEKFILKTSNQIYDNDNDHFLTYQRMMETNEKGESANSETGEAAEITPIHNDAVLPPSKFTVKSALHGLFYKKERLDYARNLYENFAKTKDKDISWIDKGNKIQLLWALDYLKKSLNITNLWTNFTAKDDEEVFQQICAYLDCYTLRNAYVQYEDDRVVLDNEAEKELFILKMRNSWNQKNFRDKKDIDSAMQNFLRKKTHKQLIEIANSYGVSIREALEEIIKNEHEKL